jgi:hypothetical protein
MPSCAPSNRLYALGAHNLPTFHQNQYGLLNLRLETVQTSFAFERSTYKSV